MVSNTQKLLPLVSVLIYLLISALKDKKLNLPDRYIPWFSMGLGMAAGVVQAVLSGSTWPDAMTSVVLGAGGGGLATWLHEATQGDVAERTVPPVPKVVLSDKPPPIPTPSLVKTEILKDVPEKSQDEIVTAIVKSTPAPAKTSEEEVIEAVVVPAPAKEGCQS